MKTNQQMIVKINEDLSFTIGHKTRMGKVEPILAYGNLLREQRGLRPIELKSILKKQDFWEFVIARNTQKYRKKQSSESELALIQSDYTLLQDYKTDKGEIIYGELTKQFPHLIKSQRGGKIENRGYWADLHILLKIASILDKDLELQIYDKFIKGKMLELRDSGGEAFKKLNIAIDTLSDRVNKDNKSIYMQVANKIREKLNILDSKGYNDADHTIKVLYYREKILDTAVRLIDMDILNTSDSLIAFIDNYQTEE